MAARWLKASKDGKSFRFVPLFSPLEDRTVPATYYVDPALAGSADGDAVTFNAGRASAVAGLTFEDTAAGAADGAVFADLRTALDAAELNADPTDTVILATGVIPLDNSAVTLATDPGFPTELVNSVPVTGGLTLRGDGIGATIIQPTDATQFDDGLGGGPVADDLTAVFRVSGAAASLTASGFRFDGNGQQLGAGFLVNDGATAAFTGVAVTDVVFQPTGFSTGIAVAGIDADKLTFADGTLTGYGAVGIQFINTLGTVTGSTIVGRGAGAYVNNGVEVQDGSVVAVLGNLITGNNGSFGGADQSSGVIVAEGGGAPATANLVGNSVTNNTLGVTIGVAAGDGSTLRAAYNNIVGNTLGAAGDLAAGKQDLANNWWGDASGPFFAGSGGTGDAIDSDTNLTVRPFLSYPTPRLTPAAFTDFATAQASYLQQITTLSVSVNPVGPAVLTAAPTSVSFTVVVPTAVSANTVEPAPLRGLTAADFTVTAPAGATTTLTGGTPATPGGPATYTLTVSGLTGTSYSVSASLPARAAIDPATGFLTAASNTATITVAVPPVVPPANTAPTVTGIADQTVAAGGGSTATIPFTVGDAETAPAALTVTATSSNPDFTATVGGSGASRTVTVNGTAVGTATITVTVTDAGGLITSTAFSVTAPAVPVVPPTPNAAPTITGVAGQTLSAGGTTGALPFTVGDDATAPAALTVTFTSSNASVVPLSSITLGGSGANRTVTVANLPGTPGTSVITLTVTDGAGLSTSTAFAVTLNNLAPTFGGSIPDQSLLGTASSGPLAFTVADDNTPAADLVVTAVSSNPAVVPLSSITLGGAGAARTVTVGNLPGVAGTSTITLTVRDASGAFSERTFVVTVRNTVRLFAVAADAGGAPEVQVFGVDGKPRFSFLAFESSFTGGVRVATADFDGDGTDDIVVAAGPGGAARIRVISGATGQELANFFAYDPSFRGGAFVAAGDITGTGVPSIVTGAGVGGAPHVRAFGLDGRVLENFFALDPAFRGGVSVAVGDVNGDGVGDIVTGAGPGGGPRVMAYSVAGTGAPTILTSYFAFDPSFAGGVSVAAGSFGIAAAQGTGGNNEVRVLNGSKFIVYESTVTGGVRLGSFDFDGDGSDEILTAAGPFGGARIQGYTAGGTQVANTFAFDTVGRFGYFIG